MSSQPRFLPCRPEGQVDITGLRDVITGPMGKSYPSTYISMWMTVNHNRELFLSTFSLYPESSLLEKQGEIIWNIKKIILED